MAIKSVASFPSGSTAITTLGTITTGTWNAGTLTANGTYGLSIKPGGNDYNAIRLYESDGTTIVGAIGSDTTNHCLRILGSNTGGTVIQDYSNNAAITIPAGVSPTISFSGNLTAATIYARNASGYGVEIGKNGSIEITHSANPFIDFKDNPSDDFDCRIQQISDGLSFYVGGHGSTAIRAKLTSVGDWLVGPSAWLTGYGFNFSGTSGYSKWYRNSSTATDGYFDIASNWGSTNRTVFTIRADGNVLNYNNSYGALSDARLKENVEDASPKLEKVKQVRWVTYNKVGDDFRQLGVIAQELQKISPSLVSDDGSEEKILSVKYSVLYAMYCAAFNELAEVVDDLTAKNSALEARLAALEAKVLP